jgi:hypothetical protein
VGRPSCIWACTANEIEARTGRCQRCQAGLGARPSSVRQLLRQIPAGDIDPKSVKAQVENGGLTVTLQAPTEPQLVKIAITAGSGSQAG